MNKVSESKKLQAEVEENTKAIIERKEALKKEVMVIRSLVTVMASLLCLGTECRHPILPNALCPRTRGGPSLRTRQLSLHNHPSRALIFLWQEEIPRPS